MRDTFPGHFDKTDDEKSSIWSNCIFVFDANILLNFYRYSYKTRENLFSFLDKLKNRIWIPHRAAEEFLTNRAKVIDDQKKAYEKSIKEIKSIQRDLENGRHHPFIDENIWQNTQEEFKKFHEELESKKAEHAKRIHNDDIKERISYLFSGAVGPQYNEEKLNEIFREGERRLNEKIPPGYVDAQRKDSDDSTIRNQYIKFSDLIIWYQIIDKAKDSNRDIIMVTDDQKEDWWEKFDKKILGPHPSLVKEFQESTEKRFHMYQADTFLQWTQKYLKEEISEESLREIREVGEWQKEEDPEGEEEDDLYSYFAIGDHLPDKDFINKLNEAQIERMKIKESINSLSLQLNNIEEEEKMMESLKLDDLSKSEQLNYLGNIIEKLNTLKNEKTKIKNRIGILYDRLADLENLKKNKKIK